MPDLTQGAPAPDALPAVPAPVVVPDPKVDDAAAAAATAATGGKPAGDEKVPETPDATLARKQLVQAEKKLAKAKVALAQSESLRTRAALADDIENLLKTDPDAFFERFGLTAEDVLTASVAKASGKPATKTEAERLDALENDRATARKTSATVAEAAQRQAVEDGVRSMLSTDESFDLINTYERHTDVAKAVWEYGKKYPEMTREQAGNAVRYFARQLETQLEADNLDKLSKSKKFAAKYAPRETSAGGEIATPAGGEGKTLHNGIVRVAPPVTDDLPEEDGARWREVKRRAGIR
jgi:Ni/Co efflux regulator RcnB